MRSPLSDTSTSCDSCPSIQSPQGTRAQRRPQPLLRATRTDGLTALLDGGHCEKTPENMDVLRAMARQALLKALDISCPAEYFDDDAEAFASAERLQKPSLEESMDDIRTHIRDTLAKASQDGSLKSALHNLAPKDHAKANAQAESETEPRSQAPIRPMSALKGSRAKAQAEAAAKSDDDSSAEEDDDHLEQLRAIVRTSLTHACKDGRLESALKSRCKPTGYRTDDVDSLRSLARDTLTKAGLDGRLKAALTSMRPQSAASTAVPSSEGSSESEAEAPENSHESQSRRSGLRSLHASLLTTLLNGAQSGKLHEVLEKRNAPVEERELSLDEIRETAQQSLVRACRHGTLEAALKETLSLTPMPEQQAHKLKGQPDDESLDMVRAKAVGSFALHMDEQKEARADLEDPELLFGEDSEISPENMDLLRAMARSTLLKACRDGRLEAALGERCEQPQQQQDLEDVRRKVRDALAGASKDGRLKEALDNCHTAASSEEERSLDSVRARIFTNLMQANKDGRLLSALNGTTSDEDVSSDEEEEEESDKLDQIRATVRMSLTTACKDGRLESALKSRCKQGGDASDLRSLARETLTKASLDGRLKAALSALQGSSEKEAEADGEKSRRSSLQSLRASLLSTLVNGAQSGKLHEVLEKRNAPVEERELSLNEIRAAAQKSLVLACRNGTLEDALKETLSMTQMPERHAHTLKGQPDEDRHNESRKHKQLREDVRSVLKKASGEGKIAAAMQKVKQMIAEKDAAQQSAELRTRCRSIFEQAAREGRLSAALTNLKESNADEEERAVPPPCTSTTLSVPEESVKAPSPMGCTGGTCQSLSFSVHMDEPKVARPALGPLNVPQKHLNASAPLPEAPAFAARPISPASTLSPLVSPSMSLRMSPKQRHLGSSSSTPVMFTASDLGLNTLARSPAGAARSAMEEDLGVKGKEVPMGKTGGLASHRASSLGSLRLTKKGSNTLLPELPASKAPVGPISWGMNRSRAARFDALGAGPVAGWAL